MRDPVSFLKEDMTELRKANLEWIIRYLEEGSKPHSTVDGKEVLMLNTNNYLGLATHPKIIQASIEATKKYGAGAGAVPAPGQRGAPRRVAGAGRWVAQGKPLSRHPPAP